MPVFDVVVVGCGGGPSETNSSAYLFKPSDEDWEDCTFGLEAGSGQGALDRLLTINPNLFGEDKRYTSAQVYSFVQGFLITHAHLDHIISLVLSAGSFGGPRKRIYAPYLTLVDMEIIFGDRIWPNLASWKEEDESYKLLYTTLYPDTPRSIHPTISVRFMPINHGSNTQGKYDSAAFFVKHDPSEQEFLFFGDVEPDSVSRQKSKTNLVWRAAASKIPAKLSTIFIECSWPSGRSDETLFGHLTPEYLVEELVVLAKEVMQTRTSPRARATKRRKGNVSVDEPSVVGALNGLTVVIIHCKDDFNSERPLREIILEQVSTLVEERRLGAHVIAAEQGMTIKV